MIPPNTFDKKLTHLITEALHEDLDMQGDHSAISCIPPNKKGTAKLIVKQNGILAGVDVAEKIFLYVEPTATIQKQKQDGEAMLVGDIVFVVTASIHTILKCERVLLNCMQRMSGIATLVKTYTEKLQPYTTKLLDTRKTTPNFRLLEKEAVRIGGGSNHRFGLYDMIMLKDNHIDYVGGISNAINMAYQYVQQHAYNLKIEVETRSLEEVRQVCEIGVGKVTRIMFDNFSPQQIRKALLLTANNFETEASGGINLQNIVSYADTRVNFVSVGSIIHQAQSLDLSLKAIK